MAVRLKTLNAYVAREIASPFVAALFILTFLLLLGRVMHYADLVISRGIGFLDILRLFSFLIPFVFALTIPMALLLGVLFAFGRLSSESELTAMRAAGVSLYSLLPAPLALGAASYIVCAGITLYLIPWGNTAFKASLFRMLHSRAVSAVQEGVFEEEVPGLVLYVDKVVADEGRMEGILIFDKRTSRAPMTITAREGSLPQDHDGTDLSLVLRNGAVHVLEGPLYRRIDFAALTFSIPTMTGNMGGKDIYDMTLTELREDARRLRAKGEAPWRPLVELHERLAVPTACLIFALLGIPLGIRPPRSGKVANFSLGLAIVMIYYLCLSAGEALGRNGTLPPSLAIWSWNVLLAGLALYLLHRANMGKSLIPFRR